MLAVTNLDNAQHPFLLATSMRLTLRTLLAYRDGVLDPKDASVLEAKIHESSTAQQISQRIEQDMRNRKIAPIPVDAREFGFEANRVAEFLDDTIPTETLPEMERQCLENSMLLCEIGCCHQILSRALTIPVTIPNSLRQRVRNLTSQPISHSGNLTRILENHRQLRRFDPANVPLANANAASSENRSDSRESISSLKIPGSELRPSGIELNDGLGRQVPEYLIGSDRTWMKRAAAVSLLLVALVLVGAYAIGPIGRVQALLKKADRSNSVDQAAPAVVPAEADAPKVEIPKAENKVDALKPLQDAPKIDVPPTNESIEQPTPAEPAVKVDVGTGDAMSAGDAMVAGVEAPAPRPEVIAEKPTMSLGIEKETVGSNDLETSRPEPASASPRMQWLPLTKESGASIVLQGTVEPQTNVASWVRMNAGQFVEVGQRLVVPPLQRTEINIEPGLRWLSASENELELLPAKETSSAERPRIAFTSGKAIVFAAPGALSLELECHGLGITIQFAQPDSSMAIEVVTTLVPVEEAALADGKLETSSVVRLFSVEGELEYTIARGDTPKAPSDQGTLSVGQYIQAETGREIARKELKEAPNWFRSSVDRPIDQLAIADFQKVMNECPANQIDAELQKLMGRRQAEMVAIAARTRMMLGDYSQLFSADGVFNRKDLRIHWQTLLGQLIQSLGLEPNRARFIERIREDLPVRANSILMLLVPKSQSQLTAGADKLLVESLSSSFIDERILAIQQLVSITNKSLGYQPDKSPTDTIPAWRKALSKNEIRYAEPKSAPKEPSE